MKDTINAGIPIRVSTDDQVKEGYSLEAQKYTLTNYCKLKNWNITAFYIEEGVSGKTIADRPKLLQLLKDAENKVFDVILTYKLDRLGRNAKELLEIHDILKEKNIAIVSYSENIDTSTPSGKMYFTILAAIAENERATIAERMKTGKEQKTRLGIKSKTGKVLFGYDYIDEKYVVKPEQAAIVKMIFEKIISGQSIRSIAKELSDNKIGTSTNNNYWSPSIVRRILLNPTYKGYTFTSLYKHKKYIDFETAILAPAKNIEPIVDEETYELANAIVNSRKGNNTRKYAKSDFFFADVAYCASCGWKLYAKNATAGLVKGDKRRRYYRCYYNNHHFTNTEDSTINKCTFGAIENSVLEKLFLDYLEKLSLDLSSAEIPKEVNHQEKENEALLDNLLLRKDRLKSRKDKLLEKYLDNIIDDDQYVSTSASISDEMKEIDEKIELLSEHKKNDVVNHVNYDKLKEYLKESKPAIRDMWNLLTDDEKRIFVTSLVSKIYVSKSKIVSVVFR